MSNFTPIARLLESLNKAKTVSVNKKTHEAWASIFNFDPSNEIEIYENSLNFYKLVDHVEDSIVMLCENDRFADIYRTQYKLVKKLAPTFPLKGNWEPIRNKIDDAMILNLEYSKALFEQHSTSLESRVDDSYLNDLMIKVDSLFDDILHGSLPRDIKLKFLDDINVVKKSIRSYAFHGRDGVEQAMAIVIGRTGMNSDELLKKEHQSLRDGMTALFSSFWGFMNASNVTAGFIENARQAVAFLEKS